MILITRYVLSITAYKRGLTIIYFFALISSIMLFSTPSFGQKFSKKQQQKKAIAEYYFIEAKTFFKTGIIDSAIYYYKQAGRNYYDIELWTENVTCKIEIGISFLQRYQIDSSIYYIENAKKESESLWFSSKEDLINLERSYYLLGNGYSLKHQYDKAINYYQKGLDILELFIDSSKIFKNNICSYYSYLGLIYYDLGYYSKALDYYRQSLNNIEKLNDSSLIFQHVMNYLYIGSIHLKKHDFERAKMNYKYAKNICIENKTLKPILLCIIYNSLGSVSYEQYEFEKAIEYFNESLLCSKNENNLLNLAYTYMNLGDLSRKEMLYDIALDYYDSAIYIHKKYLGENTLEEASIYNSIGNVHKDIGQYNTSIQFYNKSLKIRTDKYGLKHFRISQNYQNLGIVEFRKGNYLASLKHYQKALTSNNFYFNSLDIYISPQLNQTAISQIDLLETIILKAEAFFCLYQNNTDSLVYLETAIANYEFALDITDKIRNTSCSVETKLMLYNILLNIYPNCIYAIQELSKLTKVEKANKIFGYFERNKSLVLYSSLLDSKAKISSGIPDSLLSYENSVIDNKNIYSALINEYDKDLGSIEIRKYENKYIEACQQYDSIIRYYEHHFPRYFDLKYQVKITLIDSVQKHLSTNECLLEYFYIDSVLYICAITDDSSYIIQNKIDKQFDSIVSNYTKHISLTDFKSYLSSSEYLYNKLVLPISGLIENKDRLIIIPYDHLYYVPFGTLINNIETQNILDFTQYNYLIRKFEIVYHYSATLWINYKKNFFNRTKNTVTKLDFVGFAPVFAARKGYTIDNISQTENDIYEDINRFLLSNNPKFRELPYSENEIVEIINIFTKHNKKANGYLLKEASESNFRKIFSSSRCVHIATHGFVNDAHPELSGIIFYSDSANSINDNGNYTFLNDANVTSNNSHNDGILYTSEIYNLQCEVDLIVLSACKTGIGELIRGEGLMAMTRGFIYAGVDNIIFTIWKVSDKQTKKFMLEFYKYFLSGHSYSKALQKSKIMLINDISTSYPLFWGGFLLIGS
jgi:CHAT domain-containing protein